MCIPNRFAYGYCKSCTRMFITTNKQLKHQSMIKWINYFWSIPLNPIRQWSSYRGNLIFGVLTMSRDISDPVLMCDIWLDLKVMLNNLPFSGHSPLTKYSLVQNVKSSRLRNPAMELLSKLYINTQTKEMRHRGVLYWLIPFTKTSRSK